MPFPLSIVITDPGPGGIPTTNNPRMLSGWVEDYQDSSCTGFGHEALRITGTVRSREDAADWTTRLISHVEVYTPTGKLRFSGFLNGVGVPALGADLSLTNMANVIIVRWGDPDGKQGTVTVSNAASIARYGRKERVLNESISLEADAINRATMILAQIAEPPNKETVTVEKEREDGLFTVNLVICGWCEALKWLTTSSTAETIQASTTQVVNLLTSYNAVNAFFDLAGASITATGHVATQFCPPDTTYYDRIDKLLSYGDTSQRRIIWGFWGRAITIAVAASADPSTITYNYSKRAGKLWITEGNFIDPWDWAPDVMVQNVDVIGPEPASGAIASLTRKYIRRATLRIGKDGRPSGALEPDDVESLPDLVASPVSKNTGITQNHQKIDTRIRDAMGPRTIRTDNPNLWDGGGGYLKPGAGGTGNSNTGRIIVPSDGTIDLDGGSIGVDEDGNVVITVPDGEITLPIDPGGGTGVTGSGANTRLAYWSGPTTLTSDADLTTDGTNLFIGGSVVTSGANSGLQLNERDGAGLWLLYGTGSLFRLYNGADEIVTITTGGQIATPFSESIVLGAYTLDLDGSLRVSGASAALGDLLQFDGTRFAPAAIDSGDITNFNEAVDDRVAALIVDSASVVWTYNDGANTLSAAVTNEAIDDRVAALLVNSATITWTYNDASNTLSAAASGFIDGSGSAQHVAVFSDANTIAADAQLTFDGANLFIGGSIVTTGTNSGLQITERDGSGDWVLYATGSVFSFFNNISSVNAIQISAAGRITTEVDSIILGGKTLTLSAGNLTKSGAGNLTLSAGGAYTGTVPATGTFAMRGASGANTRIAVFSDGNTVDGDSGLLYGSGNILEVAAGIKIASGASPGSGELTTSGDVYVGNGTMAGGALTGLNIGRGAECYVTVSDGTRTGILGAASSPGGVVLGTKSNHLLHIRTNNTARAVITAGGLVGIGSGTPTHVFELTGSDDAAKSTTTTWATTSDARTKTILDRYALGLDFLKELPVPAVFERNGRFGTTAGERAVGFVAQELERIAPGWVLRRMAKEYADDPDGSEQEVLKVNQHELSYVLMNAILELDRRLKIYGI